MYYNHFVLPFTIGINLLIIYLIILYWRWIAALSPSDKTKIKKNIFSKKLFLAIKEIFLESLLHRKIFKKNFVLGYMHSAFAFGWFLLIVVGKLESSFYYSDSFNPPYFAIFFRFFHPAKEVFPFDKEFAFAMDLILLYILSALSLAIIKRFKSKLLGLKKATKLRLGDKLAMTALWLIFPLRFFAESFSCGLNDGGSFLTYNAGKSFASFLPIEMLSYPLWWTYSLSLGLFFLALPFSRYMHIPTEIMYIFLKNMGVKQGEKYNSFTNFAVYSCSRCGICIDKCQLNTSLNNKDTQSVYFLQRLRNKEEFNNIAENCLQCGKCEDACPVGIDLNAIRLSQKIDFSQNNSYNYIKNNNTTKSKVVYFAGCMTHLSPNIEKAMLRIFEKANIDVNFIDNDGGICCGRPLKLVGQIANANEIIKKNTELILQTNAKILVTSCPICYNVFKNDYKLNIEILHHTEYIHRLVEEGAISPQKGTNSYTYHDPCELSRKNALYNEPRKVINSVGKLIEISNNKDKSMCCGASLANSFIEEQERLIIANNVINELTKNNPDEVITSCPLCKKTLAKTRTSIVKDIAEIVAENI